jgi:hypothetical protein
LSKASGAMAVVYTGHGVFVKDGLPTETPEGAETGTVLVSGVWNNGSSIYEGYGDLYTWSEILSGLGEKADLKDLTDLNIFCCYSGKLPKEGGGFKLYSLTPDAGNRSIRGTETSEPLKNLVKKLCCDKAKKAK